MESNSSSIAFRAFCSQHGLAATHQRQILFEVVQGMEGHPSPEEIYARVRRRIPSISLATVYKNLHLFVERGIVGEVSLHHGSLRIETNRAAHHHLVCRACRSITDLDEKSFKLEMEHDRVSPSFQVERYSVEVVGLCPACKEKSSRMTTK
jgi:Fur family peroxide stress response transcriptional regulator